MLLFPNVFDLHEFRKNMHVKIKFAQACKSQFKLTFHKGRPYNIGTSPLICKANQCTGFHFYMQGPPS